ncbi:MAG: hypothetical protein ACYTEU_01055 [Planctomycetota bacterium]
MMKSKIKLGRYRIVTLSVWAVSVIVLGAGYFLFYLPQKTELAQLQNQCSESQMELERAQLAGQDQTKEKMQRRCQEADRLISDFSTEHDKTTELVFEVGQIANDLRLAEFSSKNEKKRDQSTIEKSKTLDEGWLNVKFFATFDQFAQFMNQLERHCPVVFIEEVSFRRGTSSGKGHEVSLQLSFLAEKATNNKKVAMATD